MSETDVSSYIAHAESKTSKWYLPNGSNYLNSKPTVVKKCAVIGGGVMGEGIVISLLSSGYSVLLIEQNIQTLTRATESVKRFLLSLKKPSTFSWSSQLEEADLSDVDMVIEAVFEDMELKKKLFQQLANKCKSSVILASNTSTLDIDEIGSLCSKPNQVVGMHFFNPPPISRLIEVIYGTKTGSVAVATVIEVSKRLQKLPILMKSSVGFCGNRMCGPYFAQSLKLLEMGMTPELVDSAMVRFGFLMGPFKMLDLIGMDTVLRIKSEQKWHMSMLLDELVERKMWGRKTGIGWYKYENNRRRPNPELQNLLKTQYHKSDSKSFTDEEIFKHCLYPLINEGFKILEDKAVHRPSDIDLVWINGYGWPLNNGGPMTYAGKIGVMRIFVEILRQYEMTGLDYWKPCDLMYEVGKMTPSQYAEWLKQDIVTAASSKL